MRLKISRYLKNERSTLRPIMFKISFGYKEVDPLTGSSKYKPLLYNSELKVTAKEWNNDLKLPNDRKLIAEIIRMEEVIESSYDHMVLQKQEITPETLARELDILFDREVQEVVNVIGICDYIETVMEVDPKRSDDNRKNYKYLKKHIRTFEGSIGELVTTKNLDRGVFLKFMDDIRVHMGTANSVWKIEKNLKAVLNDIRRNYQHIYVFNPAKELHANEKAEAVNEDKIYLDFNYIKAIIDYEPKNSKESNVKLILLTLLFSGCRYSDVHKVIPEYTYNDGKIQFQYARFITQKGSKQGKGKEVIVPILKPLEDAIAENGGIALPISNQKFNEYVKELFRSAELCEDVKVSYTDSHGQLKFKSGKLCEMVSSHIGRRSFVTNFIHMVPVTILSKITGHSLTSKDVIFRYNKISLLDNAVLFIKELQRITEFDPDEFPIRLVNP